MPKLSITTELTHVAKKENACGLFLCEHRDRRDSTVGIAVVCIINQREARRRRHAGSSPGERLKGGQTFGDGVDINLLRQCSSSCAYGVVNVVRALNLQPDDTVNAVGKKPQPLARHQFAADIGRHPFSGSVGKRTHTAGKRIGSPDVGTGIVSGIHCNPVVRERSN